MRFFPHRFAVAFSSRNSFGDIRVFSENAACEGDTTVAEAFKGTCCMLEPKLATNSEKSRGRLDDSTPSLAAEGVQRAITRFSASNSVVCCTGVTVQIIYGLLCRHIVRVPHCSTAHYLVSW